MTARDDLLQEVWAQIDVFLEGAWIENWLAMETEDDKDRAFAEVAPIVRRLLECGASREELSRLLRWAAYETAFEVLVLIDEAGATPDSEFACLHESLLTADPTGREGRISDDEL